MDRASLEMYFLTGVLTIICHWTDYAISGLLDDANRRVYRRERCGSHSFTTKNMQEVPDTDRLLTFSFELRPLRPVRPHMPRRLIASHIHP